MLNRLLRVMRRLFRRPCGWTRADLDAVEAAITSGELLIQYRDKTVHYGSIPELLEVRAEIRRQLSPLGETG